MNQAVKCININGFESRVYHRENPGKPSLVLLPGNLQEIESIEQINCALSNEFDYYVIELPGTGLTKPLHPKYTINFQTDCLIQFVKEYIKVPIHLIALSYATPIGLEYAKSQPIEKLVLGGSMREIPKERWSDAFLLMSNSMKDRSQFAENFIDILSVENKDIPRQGAVYRAAKMKAKKYSEDQFMCFIYNSIRLFAYLADEFNKVACPTLCFTGDLDPYVTREECLALAEALPNSTFRTIPNTDHLFFLQKPNETIDLILSFLITEKGPLNLSHRI